MLTRVTLLFSCFYLLVAFTACGDKKGCKDDYALNFDIEAEKENGSCNFPNIQLHLHPKVGTENFSFDQSFNINGVDVKFDVAQFYLTGFEIEAETTVEDYDFPDTYLLVKGDQHMYDLGDGRVGDIKNFNLKLGVLEVDNHKDPGTFEEGHPLSPQSPSMSWSWNNGYKFIRLEGTADTDGDGSYETDFQYHLGGDDSLTDIAIGELNLAVDSETNEIPLKVDFAQFFQNIDIATENVSHGMDNIAAKMIANYPVVVSKM